MRRGRAERDGGKDDASAGALNPPATPRREPRGRRRASSGHSCVSTAAATVLGDAFPLLRRDLAAMSDEAGWSRVCAGIHYRFDVEAGSAIGRAVGELALDGDIPTTAQLVAAFPPG